MSPLVKWGLIGGGVFFLFKDQITAAIGGGAATEQPAAPTAPTPQPAPYQPYPQPQYQQPIYYPPPPAAAPAPAPTPTAVNVLPVTEDLIKKASYDWDTAVILGNRKLLSVWEWNYYRNEVGKGFGSEDFGEVADPAIKISAVDYLNRAKAKGLAGLRNVQWRYKRPLH